MTIASIAVAVLFWLGGLSRLPSAIRNPRRRPLCVALLCFAMAFTLDVSSVYLRFDRATGIPNLADLAEHTFGIVGVFALLPTIENLTGTATSRRSRFWLAAPVVAVVASAWMFFAAGTTEEATDFTDRYGSNPFIIAYWAIIIAYFAVILVELARLVRRHGGRCSRRAMRTGLHVIGFGVAVGAVYSSLKVVQLTISAGDLPGLRYIDAADSVALYVGSTLLAVGVLVPVLETAWTGAAKHLSDRLALLRLRRLWLDVTEHAPDVVLDARRSLLADLVAPQPSYRLYRRVIEIRDVQLTASTAPKSLHLPAASLALLEQRVDDGRRTDRTARDELVALLELARVWPGTGDGLDR